jgi:hypothetical protein
VKGGIDVISAVWRRMGRLGEWQGSTGLPFLGDVMRPTASESGAPNLVPTVWKVCRCGRLNDFISRMYLRLESRGKMVTRTRT